MLDRLNGILVLYVTSFIIDYMCQKIILKLDLALAGKTEVLRGNLPQYHFDHHIFHMT
jgi:hypothetical protein